MMEMMGALEKKKGGASTPMKHRPNMQSNLQLTSCNGHVTP